MVFEVELPLLDPALRGDQLAEEDEEEDQVTEGATSSKSVISSKKGKKEVKGGGKTEENVQEEPKVGKKKKEKKGEKGDVEGKIEKDIKEEPMVEKKKGKKGEKGNSAGSKEEKNVKEQPKVGKKESSGKKTKSKESIGKKNASSADLHHILSGITEDKKDKGRRSSWFSSAPLPWSKVLQFPPIEVLPPDDDLTLLRDTFRSTVRARLVLVQTLPPEKVKKSKKPKKGEAALPPPPPPKETLLSKKTIAKFDLSLRSVAWCDRAVDFSWEMDKAGNRPASAEVTPVGGSLWVGFILAHNSFKTTFEAEL